MVARRAAASMSAAMAYRPTRSNDWGFPRWRSYGERSEAATVRPCDRHGCAEPGTCPAPKSPNSPERWQFCVAHAAEYNRGWNYFEGLSVEEAAAREAGETRTAEGYAGAGHYAWGGAGDGSRSQGEMRALEVLGLESDAGPDEVKATWRRLAKANHPDVCPGDAEAAARFQAVQLAYEVLRAAEESRGGKAGTWRPA